MMPYQLSREQYGVPATFTFQANPVPSLPLTPQQQLEYRLQCSFHGNRTDTAGRYMQRLGYRLRFIRFFLPAPLWIAAAVFLTALRERRYAWVLGTLLLFAAGTNFYPMFLPHYIAAVSCLVILVSVVGLERLSRFSITAARALVAICALHFAL